MDESVPLHRDAPASSSRELSLEPQGKVVSGKPSISFSLPEGPKLRHLPEDQYNKGSLQKTHWYGRATSGNFGHSVTVDPKVLGERCESRTNHRYAVVVQDLATQWIQSFPCKTKTSQETHKSSQKFLESTRKPKVIYTDNSLEFG